MIEPAGKGGICHYTYNLCQVMNKRRPVTLLTTIDYELDTFPRTFSVAPLLNKFRSAPVNLARTIKLLLTGGKVYHIQLSQYPFIMMTLVLMLSALGKRIVVTAHNVVSHEQSIGVQTVFSTIYHLATAIIVHAESNKKEMLALFSSLDPNKVHIVPHGNYMFFEQSGKTETTDLRRRGSNILFFGYVRKYKGLLDLIKAMPRILSEVPNARLVIAGKPVEGFGPYEAEMIRLGIHDRVIKHLHYIPFHMVKEYFEMAAVVAVPYKKVYQSGIVQLAYAFGRPVVGTDTGGLSEAIEDGKSGFIVPVGDVQQLAEKTAMILKNKTLAEQMGKRASDLAKTAFSWEQIALRTTRVYESIQA